MYLYHVDRSNSLKVNDVVTLNNNFDCFDEFQISMLKEYYPEGLSFHGLKYLSYYYEHAHNSISVDSSELFSYQIESTLELLRIASYNNFPSRFQSVFGFKSLDDIWPELLDNGYKIYEIEVSSFTEFDSIHLRSALISTTIVDGGIHYPILGFSHLHSVSFLKKYLNQEISSNPKLECVAKLPFKVVREITSINSK